MPLYVPKNHICYINANVSEDIFLARNHGTSTTEIMLQKSAVMKRKLDFGTREKSGACKR
jgi:hypothetical protein